MLESFLEADINLTGTIRKDKVKSVPLSQSTKGERGDAELFLEAGNKIAVCSWNDNNEIRVTTNKTDTVGMGKFRRWSKKKCGHTSAKDNTSVQQRNGWGRSV